MKSDKLSNVLGEVIYNLLADIAAGHGDEELEAPVAQNAKGFEQECINEIISFWDGKKSATRYFLFANALKKCTAVNDILPDIAGLLAANYIVEPEPVEAKLSVNSILASIKYYENESSAPVNSIAEEPKQEPVFEKKPIEDAEEELEKEIEEIGEVNSKDVFKTQENKAPNYLVKTDTNSDAIKKKQEMIEIKKAQAAERAAAASNSIK